MIKLSTKTICFCEEYIVDLNITKDAARAGSSEKTAYLSGARSFNNLNVQEHRSKISLKVKYNDIRIIGKPRVSMTLML